MTEKDRNSKPTRYPPPTAPSEQPLLRLLISEASRRSDTLMKLAKELGVTYARLAQWRRNEALICNAHRSVHQKAAAYLGCPTVLVLTLSGTVGLNDFVWPVKASLNVRIARDLERLRQDPYLGSFVPVELAGAAPAVKLFVAFLFRELQGGDADKQTTYHWLRAMHLTAAGHVDAQSHLAALQLSASQDQSIF